MHATFTPEQREIAKTVRALVEGEAVTARAVLKAGTWTPPACDTTLLRDFGLLGVPGESALIDLLVAVEAIGATLVPSRFPWHAAAVQLLTGTGIPADVLDGRRVLTPAGKAVAYAAGAHGFVDGAVQEAVDITPHESLDPSVPLSTVTLRNTTTASPDGQRRATLVVAAQLCGVAQGAIDLAAEQARTRTQFGRVIGSFQGVAFQLADAATQHKAAWDLTLYAAWSVDNGRSDAQLQVHAAKAAAGKAAVFAAERCIQVHGGMGITMEADPHLYLRRAMVLDALFGTGAQHRRRVGELRISARQTA